MSEHKDPDSKGQLTEALAAITARSQRLLADHLSRRRGDDGYEVLDPALIAATFRELAARMMARPDLVLREQLRFWGDYLQLWQRTASRALFKDPVEPVAEPAPNDRRFKDSGWADHYLFDFIKQSYLLAARRIESAASQVKDMDPHTARLAVFYTRQVVDALAPSNFVATNPQVLKATLESGGENLVRGFAHMLEDLESGKGRLRLRMTDPEAFRLGENIAATPGKVVFQNELMQLLQYAPETGQVHQRPMLIVPPWINKFYILDLKPKNSFIKWAVAQGHTVFVISWVNPDESLADRKFEDYLLEGLMAAIGAIERATGEREVNAIGYCIGGTLLACTLAYLAAKGEHRVSSATFFTSLLDFTDVGELSVFIDEEQITRMERHMDRRGYFEGSHMANAFNLLRENELIWSFVINNYLLGREPQAFDLLYWNSDSTRMPAAMHSFYLRNMYLDNRLKDRGGVTLAGVPIDLAAIKVPVYFLSTVEDHIAPWKSTYAGTRLVSGPVRFVLGGSGHVAGVINPPAADKYHYWTNDVPAAGADEWLAGAQQHAGSWWSDWAQWIAQHAAQAVPARQPGGGQLPALEDAPGSYVKTRVQ